MINSIKNFLKKKKFILLIIGVLGFLFLTPQLASADAFGVMDVFSLQLDALDFLDSSVRKYLVFFALVIAESMAYLGIAAGVLDWAMSLGVNVTQNALVVGGWSLISGIANLILVVSFVWTGLSIILKGDSAQGQKTLFRLIGLALLVNFSLLIIGGLIDIAGLLQEGIVSVFSSKPEITLAQGAQQILFEYSILSLAQVVGMTIAEIFASLIPVGNVAAIVISGVSFLTLAITGWLPVMIFNVILNFLIGSMFFMLAALLLMRICFLWILAITAPLAVVLYKNELPGLSGFFDGWAKTLKDWLFAGVIIIFFLGLGFKLFGMSDAGAVIQGNPLESVPIFGNFVPKFFLNYIFLFLYMIVICVIMAKNWMPSMGQQIIGEAKGFVSKTKGMIQPHAKRDVLKWEAKTQRMTEDRRSMSKEDFVAKYSEGEYMGSGFNELLSKPFSAYRKYVKREAPGGAQRELGAMLAKESEGYKDLTADQLKSIISTEIGRLKMGKGVLNTHNITSALTGMSSKELGKFIDQNENNEALMKQVQNASIIGGQDLRDKIMRVSIRGDNNDDQRLKKFGNKSVEDVIKESTGERCLDINLKAFENPQVLEAVAKNWKGNEFGLRAKKDNEFIDTIVENFEEVKSIAEENNPSLHKYLTSNASPFMAANRPNYKAAGQFFERMDREVPSSRPLKTEPGQDRDVSQRESKHTKQEPGQERDH